MLFSKVICSYRQVVDKIWCFDTVGEQLVDPVLTQSVSCRTLVGPFGPQGETVVTFLGPTTPTAARRDDCSWPGPVQSRITPIAASVRLPSVPTPRVTATTLTVHHLDMDPALQSSLTPKRKSDPHCLIVLDEGYRFQSLPIRKGERYLGRATFSGVGRSVSIPAHRQAV